MTNATLSAECVMDLQKMTVLYVLELSLYNKSGKVSTFRQEAVFLSKTTSGRGTEVGRDHRRGLQDPKN